MPYTVKHDPALDLIEVSYSGLVTGADLRDATSACAVLQREKGITRFLVDSTAWDLRASIVDVFELTEHQYVKEGFSKEARIAIVLPTSPKSLEVAHFYETACRNRGWNARLWPNRRSAIEWLCTEHSAN